MTQRTLSTLDGDRAQLDEATLEALRAQLRGPLLEPDDDGFADATRLWNGMIDKTPSLVAQPTGPADVVAAVDFARENDVSFAVKAGGHNIAGTALVDDGLVLDLSRLRGVLVDPKTRRATVQGGCLVGDVDRETQLHGLATPLGFVSETGVAGLTLGGGFGYLTRRFGWTVDNLLEVEIVTADGTVRTASRDEHEDLFWAVRGAGHNLGVVTSFTFELHEVGPTVYGGLIAWPIEHADQILDTSQQITREAPRELTVFTILRRAPAAPFVPEAWRGEPIVAMVVCYTGEADRVDEALAPLRALPEPIVDLLQEQPYTALQSFLDATQPKGNHYYWKTEFATGLDDELAATMRDLGRQNPIPGGQVVLAHIGGALNEHDEEDGAVGNRQARFVLAVAGMWDPEDPDGPAYKDWVRDAWGQIAPHARGNYINFQTADEGLDRIQDTYGANYERLVNIKQRYDPGNLFRSNRNIRPDGGHQA